MLDKSFPKTFFCQGVKLYFKTIIFEQSFYHFVAEYLVKIGTYKNAEEKIHFFQAEAKT